MMSFVRQITSKSTVKYTWIKIDTTTAIKIICNVKSEEVKVF